MLSGNKLRFPVEKAAGIVAELLLKYPPKGQPLLHKLRNWHGPRPCHPLVKFATLPIVTILSAYFDLILLEK